MLCSACGAGSGSGQQDRLAARLADHAPPRAIAWRVPTPPAAWQPLAVSAPGERAWRLAGSGCVVRLQQPTGLGTARTPTSDDVADRLLTTMASTVPGAPRAHVAVAATRAVTNRVHGLSGVATVRFTTRVATLGPTAKAYVMAYRWGDRALELSATCAAHQYTSGRRQIHGFADRLQMTTSY